MPGKTVTNPIANTYVMLREEFDDWAVLFNPDAGLGFAGFGLNPTGVYLWKLLDGEHPIDNLLEELRDHAEDVPEDAREHIRVFVDALVAEGLAGCADTGSYREKSSHAPLAASNEVKPFTYEPPKLVNLSSGQTAQGDCATHGSSGASCNSNGATATTCCITGSCALSEPQNGMSCGNSTCCSSGDCAGVSPYGSGPCGMGCGPPASGGYSNYCCSTGGCAGNNNPCVTGSGKSC